MPGYPALRRLLFRLDPETATGRHGRAASAPGAAPARLGPRRRNLVDAPALHQTLFGRTFTNPVGLAAGFDKDALAVRALPALGFGFAEVGTVTPRPRPGNPRPRLFRHPGAQSLQNALGFNKAGWRRPASAWSGSGRPPLPLGVNLGKNKVTPPDAALGDYETLIRTLSPFCDYLVVNLSSPNTPGLRDLQNEAFLRALLAVARGSPPSRSWSSSLPTSSPPTRSPSPRRRSTPEPPGSSPPTPRSTTRCSPERRTSAAFPARCCARRASGSSTPWPHAFSAGRVLISVGGIDSGAEAYRRLRAGASLVQIYTALVYEGPGLPRRINEELLALMARDGVKTMAEAVGAGR